MSKSGGPAKTVDTSPLRLLARARGLRRALEERFYLAKTIWPNQRDQIEALILSELDAVAIEAEGLDYNPEREGR